MQFVEADFLLRKLVKWLVGVLANESSRQRKAIIEMFNVGLLLLEQAEFVSEPEWLDEFVLSPLLSLLERILIKSEEIVKEVNVEEFDLIL